MSRIASHKQSTTPPPALLVPASVLEHCQDILEETIRDVTEGVRFAWRKEERDYPSLIRNGVWWNPSGSRVISLAVGDILHAYPGPHYETFAFEPEDVPEDICNHHSFEEAEACALLAMRTGHWCYTE